MEKQTLDRRTPPSAAPMQKIPFPAIHSRTLSNGVRLHLVPFGRQEVVEIGAIFPAGRSFEPAAGIATFTGKMLQEGTRKYNSLEFARKLDEFGAAIHVDTGYESVTVGLTTLTKHLNSTVPLLQELILYPTFPEKDLKKLKSRMVQHLDVEEKKTGYTARKEFNRLLFGQDHPYGRNSEKEDVQIIENETLKGFYDRNYNLSNMELVVVGRYDETQLIQLLEDHFSFIGSTDPSKKVPAENSTARNVPKGRPHGLQYFEKEESMQATVRVGHMGFARSHPDYYCMQVVNTCLGGYFGSRLMKNIREEKGFTYGIGSAWLSMKYGGFFLVQTDVGNEYIQPTLTEIDKEIRLLVDEGIRDDELRLVKNYMLGRTISGRETPGQILELVKNMLANEIPFRALDDKFDIIQAVTSEQVQELAAKYLQPDQMLQVVCGKMEK